jgi:hypothetical protein
LPNIYLAACSISRATSAVVGEQLVVEDAGIVHQHIQAAEALERGVDDSLCGGRLGDVGGDESDAIGVS